jgi:hypothetical protein
MRGRVARWHGSNQNQPRSSRRPYIDYYWSTTSRRGQRETGSCRHRQGLRVYESIYAIVKSATVSFNESRITVKNAAGRTVYVEFAPDPDIVIREEMAPASFAEKIAIEVKSGGDFSNIHNRIGEAEESHQKARGRGFGECRTVVNVDRLDTAMASRESPSTNRFYRLSAIIAGTGPEYADFRNRIISLTGITV